MHGSKVGVARDQRPTMMPCEGGDPEVVTRNWGSAGLQLITNLGVVLRSFAKHWEQSEKGKICFHPGFVGNPLFRLADAIEVFAENDSRERQLVFMF